MAEEKKLPRHKRLYKDSPKLERGEDGHMGVSNDHRGEHETEGEKIADDVQSGDDGMKVTERHATERTQLKHKHMKEHMDIHTTNELEHMGHKGGDKSEMHSRHHEKLKHMHKEHEAETKAMHGRHEKEMGAGESKEMSIDGKDKGHETTKDKAASEPKAEKKE